MNIALMNHKPVVSFQGSDLFAYKKTGIHEISLDDSKKLASQLLELMKREDVQSNIEMNCGFKLPDGSVLTTTSNKSGFTLINKGKRIDLSAEKLSDDKGFNELFALYKDTLVAKSSTVSMETLESVKPYGSQAIAIDKEDTHRLVSRLLKEIDNKQGGFKVLPSSRSEDLNYISFSVGGKEVKLHPCGGYGDKDRLAVDTGESMDCIHLCVLDFAKDEKNPVLELDQKIKDIVAQQPKVSLNLTSAFEKDDVTFTSALRAQALFKV